MNNAVQYSYRGYVIKKRRIKCSMDAAFPIEVLDVDDKALMYCRDEKQAEDFVDKYIQAADFL